MLLNGFVCVLTQDKFLKFEIFGNHNFYKHTDLGPRAVSAHVQHG
jgi:predicted RNA binding protein YcfA (HicA-like mRNA interferase family)